MFDLSGIDLRDIQVVIKTIKLICGFCCKIMKIGLFFS